MLTVDKYSNIPIYEQIIDGIEKEILLGMLGEGSAIPSVRELSMLLSINPNTIQRSFAELERREVICTVVGRGSFVREGAAEAIRLRARGRLTQLSLLVRELHTAGVTRDEILTVIEGIYGKEKEEN